MANPLSQMSIARPIESLATPIEIYQTTKKIFDKAFIEIVYSDRAPKMSIHLFPHMIHLKIQNAVQRICFIKNLIDLKIKKTKTIEADEFKCEAPLNGIEAFERFRLDETHETCSSIAMNFLEKPDDEALQLRVRKLGLSPDSAAKNPQDTFLKDLFKNLIKDLAVDDPRLVNFRTHYNTLAQAIVKDGISHHTIISRASDPGPEIIKKLNEYVLGQDHVCKMIADFIRANNPEENFTALFAGSSGIGKTEMAKAIAKIKDIPFVSFEMNNFTTPQQADTLTGAAAGYVGSTSKSQLAIALEKAKTVTKKSDSHFIIEDLVILFDEFDRADANVQESLMTLFDEKHYTLRIAASNPLSSNKTIRYELKKCFIIATTNLCQSEISKAFSDRLELKQIEKVFEDANLKLDSRQQINQVLLNRFRSLIPFSPLSSENFVMLIRSKFEKLQKDLVKDLKIRTVHVDDRFFTTFAALHLNDGTNMRRINNFLARSKERIMAESFNWGDLRCIDLFFTDTKDSSGLMMRPYHFSPILQESSEYEFDALDL